MSLYHNWLGCERLKNCELGRSWQVCEVSIQARLFYVRVRCTAVGLAGLMKNRSSRSDKPRGPYSGWRFLMTTACCRIFRGTLFCKLILTLRSVTQFSQILGLIIWQLGQQRIRGVVDQIQPIRGIKAIKLRTKQVSGNRLVCQQGFFNSLSIICRICAGSLYRFYDLPFLKTIISKNQGVPDVFQHT